MTDDERRTRKANHSSFVHRLSSSKDYQVTPRILIAGTNSGVGKTTITLGLIAALKKRGLQVQPYKAGPDYIDPTYHTLAAGRPCRNIDTWMVLPERALALFNHAAQHGDIAVIEGVMGVFDGFSYSDEEGSTAQIAKLVNAPVLLILDVGKMARSAGALAQGYTRFDPDLNIAGFILNRCGSTNHYEGVKQAVENATGLPVVGWLRKDADLYIPERHLGLVPTDERGELTTFIAHAADVVTEYFDLDRILQIAKESQTRRGENTPWQANQQPEIQNRKSKIVNPSPLRSGDYSPKSIIAVARDAAFSFYYEDNLDLLREAGAEIAFFSPLADIDLPPDTSGIYFGGGFPEMFAARLSANQRLWAALKMAHAAGMPIYAECGGFMILTEAIIDLDGRRHPMAELVPGETQMEKRRMGLGYRLVETPDGNFLLPPGVTTRGHEFHWSSWSHQGQVGTPVAWQIQPRTGTQSPRPDGYANGNLIASYVHLHFACRPEMAKNFVQACKEAKKNPRVING